MFTLEEYWTAVRAKVCVNCIDSDGEGNCRLAGRQQCSVQLYFPQILKAVLSVKSTRMEPYVEALRGSVCVDCRYQSGNGQCALRQSLDCGLDRYFQLVVEAIEQVHAGKKNTVVSS